MMTELFYEKNKWDEGYKVAVFKYKNSRMI